MAEKMKQSSHLYLKIASKYAENKPEIKIEPDVSNLEQNKNLATKQKATDEDIFDDLDEETDRLIQEMKANSREQKLLKIKDLDKMQAEETKSKAVHKTNKNEPDKTSQLLNNLGVQHMDQDDFQAQVAKETATTLQNGVF